MFKKMLAIILITTSLTNLNLCSQGTEILPEQLIPEEKPIKLLAPLPPQKTIDLKRVQLNQTEQPNLVDLEGIPIKLLAPLPDRTKPLYKPEAYRADTKTKAEMHERLKAPIIKIKEPETKTYKIKDLIHLLKKLKKIKPKSSSASKQLLAIRDEYQKLNRFTTKALQLVDQKTFNLPIEVAGIKDISNIAENLTQIIPNDSWTEMQLGIINNMVNNVKYILRTLENLILSKQIEINREKGTPREFIFREDEEKNTIANKEKSILEITLVPYPSILTPSIKNDPLFINQAAAEITRRIKGLLKTIRNENLDISRNSILRFLKNYGLIIWAPKSSDLESLKFNVYKPEEVDAKFTEKHINTLDKIALEKYLIYLIDQLTRTKPESFEELIKLKEELQQYKSY